MDNRRYWRTVDAPRSDYEYSVTEDWNIIFQKTAKINLKGSSYAVTTTDVTSDPWADAQRMVLNNDITLTGVDVVGISSALEYEYEPLNAPGLNISSVYATKLTISATNYQSDPIAGIRYSPWYQDGNKTHDLGILYIGNVDESFKRTIQVTSDAGNNNNLSMAIGIFSGNQIIVHALLAAPITVKATSKLNMASAYGIVARSSSLYFHTGIAADISASATGRSAYCSALYGKTGLFIRGDIAGKITSTATVTNDSTESASACGISVGSGNLTIDGKLANKITVTGTSKQNAATAYGVASFSGMVALGGISGDMSVSANGDTASVMGVSANTDDDGDAVDIAGDITGKISVKAVASSSYAEAYGFAGSSVATVSIHGTVGKEVAVSAEAKQDSAWAMAFGFDDTTVNLNMNDIAAEIKASAKGKNAYSQALFGGTADIDGDICGKISATAAATGGDAEAIAVNSWNCTTLNGSISSALTATATTADAGGAKAGVICSSAGTVGIRKGISSDLSATATVSKGLGEAVAFVISGKKNYVEEECRRSDGESQDGTRGKIVDPLSQNAVSISGGDVTGKLTAKAQSANGMASAFGIYAQGDKEKEVCGDIAIEGVLTKGIAVSAISGTGTTIAAGIYASYADEFYGGDITIGGIASDIIASTKGGAETAYGICATGELTIHGDISGNITATVTDFYEEESGGAIGISARSMVLDGDITKTITVKNGVGVNVETLQLRENLGTVVASGDYAAMGWYAREIQATSGHLKGKATVTSKGPIAVGMWVGKMTNGNGNQDVQATLDITVKGTAITYGIALGDEGFLTLKDSKITVTGENTPIAVGNYEDDGDFQYVELLNTIVNGQVALGDGNDSLILAQKSKIVGDVLMEEGTYDFVEIYSGSQIKGRITGAEQIILSVNDASEAKTVMWEGGINQSSYTDGAVIIDVNGSIGETGTYALTKDTDGSGWAKYRFALYLDGMDTGKTFRVGETISVEDSRYNYSLSESKDKKTLSLVTTQKNDEFTVDTVMTEGYSLLAGPADYLFTGKSRMTIKDGDAGIVDVRLDSEFDRTLILNNDLTLTNKNADNSMINGVISRRNYDSAPGTPSLLVRSAEKPSKMTISNDVVSNDDTVVATGIEFSHYYDSNAVGELLIGAENEKFRKSIRVTASNRGSNGAASAAIYSANELEINSVLDGEIVASATAKADMAEALGIVAQGDVYILDEIDADISATATGANAVADCIKSSSGNLRLSGDLDGALTAVATADQVAIACGGFSQGTLDIEGEIEKSLSAKATSKNGLARACVFDANSDVSFKYGIDSDLSVTATGVYTGAYVINAGNEEEKTSANIVINGDIDGKITAVASGTGKEEQLSYAVGLFAIGDIQISGKIRKAISSKYTSTQIGLGYAVGILCDNLTVDGIDADISVSAAGYMTMTQAIKCESMLMVNGDVNGKITTNSDSVTAGMTTGGIEAAQLFISGRINQAITCKATGKSGGIVLSSIMADTVSIGGIASDITSIAAISGNGNFLVAHGISGTCNMGDGSEENPLVEAVRINGDLAGKLTVTATAGGGLVNAYGIYAEGDSDSKIAGDIYIAGEITKGITVKASTKVADNVSAYGIFAEYGAVVLGGITADISVSASGTSVTEVVDSYGIVAEDGIVIYGDIAGNITLTSTASDSMAAGGIGISTSMNLTVNGSITKNITITAKSAWGEGTGVCVYKNMTIEEGMGTVVINSGISTAWSILGSLTVGSGHLTGKATVTGNHLASGLCVGKILDGEGNADVVATLDITCAAQGKEIGISFRDDATLTLKDSKITMKHNGENSWTLYDDSGDTSQDLTLNNSVMNGNVNLKGGGDRLILTNKSKIIGDVLMGDGIDEVVIQSGSQVKGAMSDVEDLWLKLNDASAAKTALWEGDFDGQDFDAMNLNLDVSSAAIGYGEYTLLKDVNGYDWDGMAFNLYLDGQEIGEKVTYGGAVLTDCGLPYGFTLKTDSSRKSLILVVTQLGD